jgi:hypothetical protein
MMRGRTAGIGPGNCHPYTSAVRRWVCIFVLLFGFTGQEYAWSKPSRAMVTTHQPLARMPRRGPETQPESWWFVQ